MLLILTKNQKKLMDFIASCIKQDLCPPSIREMAEYMEFISTTAIVDKLAALKKKGWIVSKKNKVRSVIPTPEARDRYGLWFIGEKQ